MHEGLRLQERTALLQAEDGGLEPYNPDFNPIEQVFAKLKGLLRTAAARTVPDLGTPSRKPSLASRPTNAATASPQPVTIPTWPSLRDRARLSVTPQGRAASRMMTRERNRPPRLREGTGFSRGRRRSGLPAASGPPKLRTTVYTTFTKSLDSSGLEKSQHIVETKEFGGAGDRDRTDDIQLGKLTFYH